MTVTEPALNRYAALIERVFFGAAYGGYSEGARSLTFER